MDESEVEPREAVPVAAPREQAPVQRAEPPPAAKKQSQAKRSETTAPARKTARKEPAARQHAAAKPARLKYRVQGVGYGDALNVRNGPSEYHPAIGTIPAEGRGVEIVGACRDLWCPIRHGRTTGWVNRYYLAEEGVQRTTAHR